MDSALDSDEIIAKVKACETESRFRHSKNVAEIAASLADCHGVDPDLAWTAGILHDIAKHLDKSEMLAGISPHEEKYSGILTDSEFDAAVRTYFDRRVDIHSVSPIMELGGYIGYSGRMVRKNRLLRSGELSHITPEDSVYLRERKGLSVLIDLRTPEEIRNVQNRTIKGVRYKNLPLLKSLHNEIMMYLTRRYFDGRTPEERTYILSEYARADIVREMYLRISTEEYSRDALKRIFRLCWTQRGRCCFTVQVEKTAQACCPPSSFICLDVIRRIS